MISTILKRQNRKRCIFVLYLDITFHKSAMKKSNFYIMPLAILGILLLLAGVLFLYKYMSVKSVSNFAECVNQGYTVLETYPEQCRTPDGKVFTQVIEEEDFNEPLSDEVTIHNPQPDQFVSSPLLVNGYVPGPWFFEGFFPVELHNSTGEVIATAQGTVADGSDWMTEEFVYFEATLEFDQENITESGTVVLRKSNPSGLPENEDSESVSIKFSTATASGGCVITGCSSHICAEEDQVTTCEYREEYACYQTAKCERQSDGACGWTMTDELQACLDT